MRQKRINLVKLLKGYKRGWVAISDRFDRVVVWGKTLREAMKKAKEANESVFYFPVEKSYSDFIGIDMGYGDKT